MGEGEEGEKISNFVCLTLVMNNSYSLVASMWKVYWSAPASAISSTHCTCAYPCQQTKKRSTQYVQITLDIGLMGDVLTCSGLDTIMCISENIGWGKWRWGR